MSNTRCELINWMIVPLVAAVGFCLLIPELSSTSELNILYLFTFIITVLHVHYGVCVVLEMSRHLRIDPLRIKDHGEVRLIKADNDDASDAESDDDSGAVDINDLEVIVASNSRAGQQSQVVLQV